MRITPVSVDSLMIYFGDKICQDTALQVQNAYAKLKASKEEFTLDIIPSYTSILVQFDILHVDLKKAQNTLEHILKQDLHVKSSKEQQIVQIPVYYDKEVGFDLEDVANFHNLSVEDVIRIHSQKSYLVYAIGFLPGFAYMGEVDERIKTPRIDNPRPSVQKGSVGIADAQTAVYPQKSPGGWRILGRTYLDLFDFGLEGYSLLKVGDLVRYKPISKEEFLSNGGVI